VSTVLSGMGKMQQVEENLHSAEASAVHSLASGDLEMIGKVRQAYRSMYPIPCTGCVRKFINACISLK